MLEKKLKNFSKKLRENSEKSSFFSKNYVKTAVFGIRPGWPNIRPNNFGRNWPNIRPNIRYSVVH